MRIMSFVAKHVRSKSWLYHTILIVCGILTVILALGEMIASVSTLSIGPPWEKWKNQWNWYLLCSGMILAIIIVWFYYAPVVCDNLNRLKEAFQGEAYGQLHNRYQGWIHQLHFRMKGRSPYLKGVYGFCWLLFAVTFIIFTQSALNMCGFHWCVRGAFFVLTFITIVLNYSSYYLCIVFVYFLMRICKLEREEKLNYIEQYPSSTYGFQALRYASDTIFLYFLWDSLFCTIAYFSFWQIIFKAGYKPENEVEYVVFLYVALFLMLFGLISWLYIILVSRTYLHRLHKEWKLRSYQKYEELYRHAAVQSMEMDHILEDIERINKDKITTGGWELLISLVAIIANVVTTVNIFSNWPFVIK